LNIIKKILEKIGLIKTSKLYPNKGGWPGLRVLPKVDNLIDIGIGHQGSEGLYKFFPDARKFFVDPLIETKTSIEKYLKNPQNKFFECGLSSKEGFLKINIRQPISQSGFNKSKNDFVGSNNCRRVIVNTLDNLFPIHTIKDTGTWGIKIDVEGHEKEVLIGGIELIKNCDFVIVEVSIDKNKFENSPSLKEIINWMSNLNFEVKAVRASGDGTDHLDIAFVK